MHSSLSRRILSGLASLTAAAVLGATFSALPAAAAEKPELPASDVRSLSPKDMSTDRFIVKFKDKAGTSSAGRGKAYGRTAKELGISVKELRTTATGAHVVTTGEALDNSAVEDLVDQLESDPAVEFAEPDQLMQPVAAAPNDEFYGAQWDFFETRAGMRVPGAWDVSRGKGVTVAVIDTGITSHSDLNANVLPGYDMMTDPAMARDGDGRDANAQDEGDWYAAYECGDNDWASDSSWHGTHVAGTIAAVTGNGQGVAGVAPDAKILPVRALGACGGYMSDIADSIIWAAGGAVPGAPANTTPAKVINLSLGGFGLCSATSQSAVNQAVHAGSAVVVAAGNENIDASWSNPANCENVITVAASGREGNRASYSNYGYRIDVTAPGGDMSTGVESGIASTLNAGTTVPGAENYVYYQGTSMAAPHVAGLAALWYAELGGFATPAAIEQRLKETARPMPGNCAEGCGAGLVDATAFMDIVVGEVPSTPQEPQPEPTPEPEPDLALSPATPAISGIAAMDRVLTAEPGDWQPAPVDLSYQWNVNGAPIRSALGKTYTPTIYDVDEYITVTVTGSKDGYVTESRTSNRVGPIEFFSIMAGEPTITGTPKVGGRLDAATGTWSSPYLSFTYQWSRNGTAIPGATASSYTPVPADLDAQITVTVTGSSVTVDEPVSATSAPTAPVTAGTLTAGTPTITGTAAVGSKLTAVPGTWTAGTSLSYQWHRNGDPIAGATGSTYTPVAADRGAALMVTVSGSLDGYVSTNRSSTLTAAVANGTLSGATPTISGTKKVGYALTANAGTWTAGTTLKYQWFRSGAAISGATSSRYTLAAADAGKYLTARVTGTAAGYNTVSRTSASSGTIAYGTLASATPGITGTKKVGYTLTANAGTWTAGTTLKYQWYRGTSAISRATGRSYVLTGSDAGKQISVRVTGTKSGYTSLNRWSAKTSYIAKGTLKTSAPVIKGALRPGYTLTAYPGTWTSGTTLKYQWYRSGTAIRGATGKSYRLVAADRYDTIKVRVTGTKTGYTTASRY